MTLRQDAERIMKDAIAAAKPDAAVKRALLEMPECSGRVVLVAIGKAAWQMAKAAYEELTERIDTGIVITKYDHVFGPIGPLELWEAGHPVPDDNSYLATERALSMTEQLCKEDLVLFLVSGGGSALFEKPLIESGEMESLTKALLASGADITQMNTIRKHLSGVKGGRFAEHCFPARIFSVVLSDIIGDPLDMIASGPAYPDSSTSMQALKIVDTYGLTMSESAKRVLHTETPKQLNNATTMVTGSVKQLVHSAEVTCRHLGYETVTLTDTLQCEARQAGKMLAELALRHRAEGKNLAFFAGGETVVLLRGNGKGGRNQEIALAAAPFIEGMENVAVFSFGSDGTDGPTDAAGGYVDGFSESRLKERGQSSEKYMEENNSYEALKAVGGLLITGPTGTNVNDLSVLLIRGE